MILGAVYHTILAVLFAAWAILLMIVILLQRGKGVGLSGAFGGAGGGAAFGAKTGDVLTWVTVFGAVVLLAFTVVLNYVFVETGPGLQSAVTTPAPGAPVQQGAPVTPGAGASATPPGQATPSANPVTPSANPAGSSATPAGAPTAAPATPPEKSAAPSSDTPAEKTTGWLLETPLPPAYAAQTIFGETYV